ncbi:FT-interacting protein 1-like protein [Tanacetum coccineum]
MRKSCGPRYFDRFHQASKTYEAEWRSKVLCSAKRWYLRVNVIEARDLIPNDRTRFPKVLVKAVLGHQALRTMISMNKSTSPMWNEDLMFVAAEPFDEHLILSVEDRVRPNKDSSRNVCNSIEVCGSQVVIMFSMSLLTTLAITGRRLSILWKKYWGFLSRILSAHRLSPMKTKDGRETTDAYCVAKYGTKWVRTRTIIDSLMPKWNEQYTWDVYDLCTVITIGVFDNCFLQGARDSRIGRVRIRLSTLETDRVYTLLYPLLVLHPSGLKEMGEIHLAVRFTCSSLHNIMEIYSQPLWPKMHYIHPLTVGQLDSLRQHATQILSMRLSRAEPPLRKEVVEFMLDKGSHMWSARRGKANFFMNHGLWVCLIAGRPKNPPHIDTRISFADNALPDELDEEFDTFPTSRLADMIVTNPTQ